VKILCVLGQHNYGKPERGAGYEYVNFLPALSNLGHEVVFFESYDRKAYQNFAGLNRALLLKVIEEKPEIIFCVLMGYEVWTETLQMIKDRSGAILINWSTDDSWKYKQFSRYMADFFHLYATTYPSAIENGTRDGHQNIFLTQWAANSSALQKPLMGKECKYQVTFIGTAYGIRPKLIAQLKNENIKVECFGYGWENGAVTADEIPKIIRESLISLNFGDSGIQWSGFRFVRSRQIKARIFEVTGSGGFLITENAENIDKFYGADEIETFEGVNDLVLKIKKYLNHTELRDRIALAGFNRTAAEHIYEIRFESLLSAAIRIKESNKKNMKNGLNMIAFDDIEKKHRVGNVMRLMCKLWSLPFVAIWGRLRGPRAARRIMFELSWRLLGRKTYSASGWPGRLFYRQS